MPRQLKVVALSDTHGLHGKLRVAPCDLLLVAGDITRQGRPEDLKSFNDWLEQQPVKAVLLTPGNHDGLLSRKEAQEALPRARVVINETVEAEGLKIFMSPNSLPTGTPAWQWARESALERLWQSIPQDVDVVVSHGPAFGINDASNGLPTGDAQLRSRLGQLPKLKLLVTGHVHECAGSEPLGEALAINASALNGLRRLAYSPWELDFDGRGFSVIRPAEKRRELLQSKHA